MKLKMMQLKKKKKREKVGGHFIVSGNGNSERNIAKSQKRNIKENLQRNRDRQEIM